MGMFNLFEIRGEKNFLSLMGILESVRSSIGNRNASIFRKHFSTCGWRQLSAVYWHVIRLILVALGESICGVDLRIDAAREFVGCMGSEESEQS